MSPEGNEPLSKKKSLYATDQRTQKVRLERARFVKLIRRFCASRFVFLDEFGCNTAMTRRYGRGRRGKRVRSYAPVNYGPNVSVLAAMRQGGIEASMRVEGATSGEVFLTFLRHFLVPKLKQGDIVVMDNLAAHKVDGVHQLITSAGARVRYFPPYSPDYNPIELAFSKIKGILRSKAAWTKESLDQALTQASSCITTSDTAGWIGHCGYALLNR